MAHILTLTIRLNDDAMDADIADFAEEINGAIEDLRDSNRDLFRLVDDWELDEETRHIQNTVDAAEGEENEEDEDDA